MNDPFQGHPDSLGDNAQQVVKSYITRIEALEEDKRALTDDIRSVYTEAKGNGFDAPALRRAISERRRRARMGEIDYEAEANIIDLYLHAADGGK